MYVKIFIITTRGIISIYNCYAANGRETNKKIYLKKKRGKKKLTKTKQME